MNRRHFLAAVSSAVGAFALDPELALWVPGQRTYFDIQQRDWVQLSSRDLIAAWDELQDVGLERFERLIHWKVLA